MAVPRRAVIGSMALALVSMLALGVAHAHGRVEAWSREFPLTDFSKRAIALEEIISGGPQRDTIPPIHAPAFKPAAEVTGVGPFEPVLSVDIAGDRRAYPLRILLWHEIVNDVVGV